MLDVLLIATPKALALTRGESSKRDSLQIPGFGVDEGGGVVGILGAKEAEKGLQCQLLGVWLQLQVFEDLEEELVVGENEKGADVPCLRILGAARNVVTIL